MMLKPTRLSEAELIAEIERYRSDTKHFHIWWMGQSGFLIAWHNKKILLDPYLSDSLTKKYASTKKPHVRISERVIDPEKLTGISMITSSHNHTDHLDADTLIPLIRNNPGVKVVVPAANVQFAADRLQVGPEFLTGLKDGDEITLDEFTVIGVPASHNDIERDERGYCKFMGYIVKFGDWTLYHSGDTLWYEGMENILLPHNVDVAFLPINGNDPARGVAGNLDAREAAELGKAIGAKLVIPCHYDMFLFNTADPEDFATCARQIGQKYCVLDVGGHVRMR